MSKRLNELICQLEMTQEHAGEKIDRKAIVDKVNHVLNVDITERKIYMRQKFLKTAAIVAMLTAITTATVFAAANTDFLKIFFKGDTSPMENFVQTPNQSVSDGRFTLTLEQVLAAKYQAMVTYSVEALTEDAAAELNEVDERGYDNFMGMDTISFGPVQYENIQFSGYGQRELMEKRTHSKRYYSIVSEAITNEDEKDFYISLNKMKDPQKIIVPMKCNVETKEFILSGQPYGDGILKYSPLGISFERGYAAGTSESYSDGEDLFFRMKDDKIKTCNELVDFTSWGIVDAGEPNKRGAKVYSRYETRGLFREITKLSEIRSIIVGNIEYDVSDTAKNKAVTIDEKLYPFELKPLYKEMLWLPVREFTEKIGGKLRWNEKTKTAIINYRGSEYVIAVGSNVVIKDGAEIKLQGASDSNQTFILDGKLVAEASAVTDAFCMRIELKNAQDEGVEVKDWIWTIIP